MIALALHVDYWDYLGWKDGFGRPGNTARQRAYAKSEHRRSIFTPEMIVQGSERVKGHDADRVLKEIARAQQRPAGADLKLEREDGTLRIHLAPNGAEVGPADIHLVRFIPSVDVAIEAGENAGHSFTYTNIVTDWLTIARWDGVTAAELTFEAPGTEPVAVLVQREGYGPMLTAARLP